MVTLAISSAASFVRPRLTASSAAFIPILDSAALLAIAPPPTPGINMAAKLNTCSPRVSKK